jgi:hypothetical protein
MAIQYSIEKIKVDPYYQGQYFWPNNAKCYLKALPYSLNVMGEQFC